MGLSSYISPHKQKFVLCSQKDAAAEEVEEMGMGGEPGI